jgi:hypothetical protein
MAEAVATESLVAIAADAATKPGDEVKVVMVSQEIAQLAQQVQALPAIIDTPEQFQFVAEQREVSRAFVSKTESFFEKSRKATYDAWQSVLGDIGTLKQPHLDRIDQADRLLKAFHQRERDRVARQEREEQALLDMAGVPEEEQIIMPQPSRAQSVMAAAPVSLHDKPEVQGIDLAQLVIGIARPAIYIELAAVIEQLAQSQKGVSRAAWLAVRDWLRKECNELPRVPVQVVSANAGFIRTQVSRSKMLLNWPGVKVGTGSGVRAKPKR